MPGTYCEVNRRWTKGDTLRIDFDFRPHDWAGRPGDKPRSLDLAWTLFGPVPRTDAESDPNTPPDFNGTEPAWDKATEMPARLAVNGITYKPVRVKSGGGVLDGRRLFPETAAGLSPSLFGLSKGKHQ